MSNRFDSGWYGTNDDIEITIKYVLFCNRSIYHERGYNSIVLCFPLDFFFSLDAFNHIEFYDTIIITIIIIDGIHERY